MLREAKFPEAQRLRKQGLTYREIADKLKCGERTLRGWFKDAERRQSQDADLQEAGPREADALSVEDWPTDREWPDDWDPQGLAKAAGWQLESAERMMAAVRGARAQDNRWIPWFIRRRAELDAGTLPHMQGVIAPRVPAWADAVAGLPVLDKWLGGLSACTEISQLILERDPWPESRFGDTATTILKDVLTLGRRRQGYAAAARKHVQEVQRRLDAIAFERALDIPLDDRPGPWRMLAALMERLPLADTVPRRSRYRDYALWQVFVGIFRFEPFEYGGQS